VVVEVIKSKVSWPRCPNRPSFDIYHRPETTDLDLVKAIPNENEKLGLNSDDIVLDLGAHIGGFSKWVLVCGVKSVICVEPYLPNFRLLRRNLGKEFSATLNYAACVQGWGSGKECKLYVAGGRSEGRHSLIAKNNRPYRTVPSVGFLDLLYQHKPSVVKIDIEGSEFLLESDLSSLPLDTKKLSIEFHKMNKDSLKRSLDIVKSLVIQGFSTEREPRFTKQWRNTVGVWVRQ